MSIPYTDRWGKQHTPDGGSVLKPRRGVFAVCLSRGHILLTWPHCAPDVPEIPGGGIEEGEDEDTAILREIDEETTVRFSTASPLKTYRHAARYFADADHEFWDYTQTYLLLQGPAVDTGFFTGERVPSDALVSRWVPLESFGALPLHAIHRQALPALLAGMEKTGDGDIEALCTALKEAA